MRQTRAEDKTVFARSPSSVGLGLAPAASSDKANRCGGSEPPPYERSSVQPLYLRQTTTEDKTVFARSPSFVGLGLAPAVYSAEVNRCGGSEPPPYERSSVQPLYLRQTTAMNKIAFARSPSSVGLGLAPAVYSAEVNRCGGSEPPPYERSSVQPLYLGQTTAEDKTVFARSPSSVGLGLAPAAYSAKANRCGGGLLQPYENLKPKPLAL